MDIDMDMMDMVVMNRDMVVMDRDRDMDMVVMMYMVVMNRDMDMDRDKDRDMDMDMVVMDRDMDMDRDRDMDMVVIVVMMDMVVMNRDMMVMDRDIDMDVMDMDRYMDMGGQHLPTKPGGSTYTLAWRVLDRGAPLNRVAKTCMLCLNSWRLGLLLVKAACRVNNVQELIWLVSTTGRRGNGAPGRAINQNHHYQQHHLNLPMSFQSHMNSSFGCHSFIHTSF